MAVEPAQSRPEDEQPEVQQPEDDRPELLVKLQERKERHQHRGRVQRMGIVALGFVIVLAGIVMSGPGVPGPGILVILIGLSFLALEFDWAERWLERVIIWADNAAERAANAPRWQKIASAVATAVAIAAFAVAAILWDIPLLPIV
jgi:uncharacterized protein (TIGR02611 family)